MFTLYAVDMRRRQSNKAYQQIIINEFVDFFSIKNKK